MGKRETLSDLRKSKKKQKSLSLHFKPSIKQEKKPKTLNSEKVSNLPEATLMGTAKGQEPSFLAFRHCSVHSVAPPLGQLCSV